MDRRGSITTYVVIAVVLIFMIASCCILKQTNILRYGPRWWNRQNRKDDNNRPAKFESFEVASVPTGNSIIVKAGRRDHTITITLGGIGIPSLPGAEEAARANLERLAGGTFQAEIPGRRLRTYTGRSGAEVQEGELWLAGNRCSDTLAQPEDESEAADPGPVEARSDFTSPFVKGENGVCLQLEQIRGGFAMIVAGPNDTIPAEWTAAEKVAKKSAIGIWSKP